jgi:hypothetical protein
VDRRRGHVLGNRKLTIPEVANRLGISFGSVQSLLKDERPVKWNSTIGFFIMTTHLLTLLCLGENFWVKTK